MSSPTVAVIDIGSNSIKILVARRGVHGLPEAIYYHTIDARISAGISKARPELSEQGMALGLTAIQELLTLIKPHAPARIVLVATSAVRDAVNGPDFRSRVRAATGHEIRILGGDEEANLIGHGLTCDPALADLRDFQVFDLGGGSLECLTFSNRRMTQGLSLQLGCVRLTEKFITNPALPLSPKSLTDIDRHVRAAFSQSLFKLSSVSAVATGGTMTSVRAMAAASAGKTLGETSVLISLNDLRSLLLRLASLSLAERQQIAGLPAARADVFPAALATMITVAELTGIKEFRHSLYNLRYGLAAELLGA